jgi:hypothetical protein
MNLSPGLTVAAVDAGVDVLAAVCPEAGGTDGVHEPIGGALQVLPITALQGVTGETLCKGDGRAQH